MQQGTIERLDNPPMSGGGTLIFTDGSSIFLESFGLRQLCNAIEEMELKPPIMINYEKDEFGCMTCFEFAR